MAFNPLLKTEQRFRSFGNGYDRSIAFLSIGYSITNGNQYVMEAMYGG